MPQTRYHALFGAKFLLALVAFYFASALVGRGQGTQWIRNDRAKWLSVTLGLTLAVVMLSGWMRQLHTGENLVREENGVRFDGDGGLPDDRYQDGEAGSNFRTSPADRSESAPEAGQEAVPSP
jgi:hypothetical protein